jgi:putative membrane protein
MATDFVLAVLHHVLAFGLVGMLVAEGMLLRPGPSGAADVERIARLDGAYGATAGALVVVGVLRVIFGAKGYAYYVENVWFWAKMASVATIALLSVRPTLRFLAWRRLAHGDAGFRPAADEIASLQRSIRFESAAVILVLVFAAAMARFAG